VLTSRSPISTVFGRGWAFPVTALGLVVVAVSLLSRGRVRRVDGAIETWGGWPKMALERWIPLKGGAEAVTLGHVIVGRTEASLRQYADHERIHVRQYERWGALLLPAYALASLWVWARGGDPYRDNVFEREAAAITPRPRSEASS